MIYMISINFFKINYLQIVKYKLILISVISERCEIFMPILRTEPVTVAERSRACTVFARSEAGTVGSNSTQGMDV
jgi:hypothetical protein